MSSASREALKMILSNKQWRRRTMGKGVPRRKNIEPPPRPKREGLPHTPQAREILQEQRAKALKLPTAEELMQRASEQPPPA